MFSRFKPVNVGIRLICSTTDGYVAWVEKSFDKKAFVVNKYLKAPIPAEVMGLIGCLLKRFSGLLYTGDQTRQSKQSLLKLKSVNL